MDAQAQPTPSPGAAGADLSAGGSTGGATPAFASYGLTPGQHAEAPKRPHLYIGNLSPRVTDYMLTEIFAVAGTVVHAKIVQDRSFSHGGFNYGFVEYADMRAAEQALQTLNGRKIFDAEVRVNWAYQGTAAAASKEDTQHHNHVFVGDLSPEVNDDVLGKAFGAFGSLSEARVMWDMNTGKSRGYGFLSFRDRADAEQAISTMNGEWLGARAIRVNWANQKTQTGGGRTGGALGAPGGPPGPGGMGMGGPGGPGGPGGFGTPRAMGGAMGGMASPYGGSGGGTPGPAHGHGHAGAGAGAGPMSYEQVVAQTPEYNSTVYVGNLIPYTTQADLIPLFQGYGYIVEIRMQADRGFAFVKLDTHQNAALAITQLQNQLVHGRPIKCSWGKDKAPGEGGAPGMGMGMGHGLGPGQGVPGGQGQMGGPMQHAPHLGHAPQGGQFPMYGYNSYYQYGYGQTGVPGQPGQQAPPHGAAPGAGHHLLQGHGQAPQQGPGHQQAEQGGQQGWDQAAAQAYYQNQGWGGYYAPQATDGQAAAGGSANGAGAAAGAAGAGAAASANGSSS